MNNRTLIIKILAILICLLSSHCKQAIDDILLSDFEDISYGDWKAEGNAFETGPSEGTLPGQERVEGYQGKRLVNSFSKGGDSKGTLTSPVFVVERKYINFLMGGGRSPEKLCINLLINDKIVHTVPDTKDLSPASGILKWATFDVSKWKGQKAVIQIVDQDIGYWGFILVDQIYQSNKNQANVSYVYDASRKINVNRQYLNIPVKEGTTPQLMSILLDNQKVREFKVELAESAPDYWMFLDVSEWKGKDIVIQISRMAAKSEGLKSIIMDSTVRGFDNLYNEKLRPQFHFTSRRGWHNDANGLVWYEGEYHLFYQHNPLGWNWGNMTWGHAVSTDLLHWKELAPAIYPDTLGTEFSGSGVIDWNNTTGFRQGDTPPMVLIYASAGGTSPWSEGQPYTQCIAYSTDKGRSWTKYSGNPVLPHIIHGNRDPKVTWYEPAKKWIMALYLVDNRFGLFESDNLKSWKQLQEIVIEGGAECPDFFEIALDGNPKNPKWVMTAANGRFLAGNFNGKQFIPETKVFPSEWGKNYYAVQTFSNLRDGRRIQIGWMAGSEFIGMPFNQQFAIPRELSLKTTSEGLRLYGNPVREIETIHGKKQSWKKVTVTSGNNLLSGLKGELYHLFSDFEISGNTNAEFGFNLRGFEIMYNTKSKLFRAHRPSDNAESEVILLPENGHIKLEILIDKASVEIFANNGLVPMAFFYIPKNENNQFMLVCRNDSVHLSSMDIYELNPVWKKN